MVDQLLTVSHLNIKDKKEGETIVKDVSFSVDTGQCIGVFGPNGVGKTTLITSILGIQPDNLVVKGNVCFRTEKEITSALCLDGTKQTLKKVRKRIKISFIPQNSSVAFDPLVRMQKQFQETILENGYSKSEVKKKVKELLDTVELEEEILMKYPFQLSGGMLQRCAIGLGFIIEPDFILMDEPTSALDAINRKRFVDFILKLKSSGVAMLLATHDIDVLDALCDKICVLEPQTRVDSSIKEKHDYLDEARKARNELRKIFRRMTK